MTRLILILIALFIIFSVLRSFIRRYRNIEQSKKPGGNAAAKKNNDKDDDDNIVDAKFEEIK